MPQWTKRCICLFELVFLISSHKYPEVELLGSMVVLFLIFFEESPITCKSLRGSWDRKVREWLFLSKDYFIHTLTNIKNKPQHDQADPITTACPNNSQHSLHFMSGILATLGHGILSEIARDFITIKALHEKDITILSILAYNQKASK